MKEPGQPCENREQKAIANFQYLRRKGGLARERLWDEIKRRKRSQVSSRFDKKSPKENYFEQVIYKI